MTAQVRAATAKDLAAIKAIAVDTGLFSADEVQMFDEMLLGALDGTLQGHQWLVLDDDGAGVVGGAYYAPEPFSDRMWNLYFLGVAPSRQGEGVGATLIGAVETALRTEGEAVARTLIVETSGVPDFEPTREFYRGQGFFEEARIRQFYGPDDDKIVFWKSLLTT